jgi:hypothetical protein
MNVRFEAGIGEGAYVPSPIKIVKDNNGQAAANKPQ